MLMHAYDVVLRRADYPRTDSGWRAEFRGPITVSVEASDLESCRPALFARSMSGLLLGWQRNRQPRLRSPPRGLERSSGAEAGGRQIPDWQPCPPI